MTDPTPGKDPQVPPYQQYPQAPPYSQYPYGQPVSYPTTNGFSVAALVCSFFSVIGGILGIIFGCVALSQIRRYGQRGRGMAIAGIVIGSCWIVLIALGIAVSHAYP